MAATGLGFAFVTAFWPLLVIAVVGTLNPSSGDVSVFLPLEHAVLSRLAGDEAAHRGVRALQPRRRAVPRPSVRRRPRCRPCSRGVPGLSLRTSLQAMFVLYGALGLARGARLPRIAASERIASDRARRRRSRESKRKVYALAALFSLDAFGGGFVVQSMVALWLYQRFGLSLAAAGGIFFWTGLLTAALVSSSPCASRTASGSSTRWCSRTSRRTSASC